MAHLIELTDSNTLEKMLFNLDTVVSIERTSGSNTVITTRWGRTNVKESLDNIKLQAESSPQNRSSCSLLTMIEGLFALILMGFILAWSLDYLN